MNCPVCGEKLREIEREGVMIDICPGCKGVWLDRGELDKLLEMSRGGGPPPAEDRASGPPPPPPAPPVDDRPRRGRDDDRGHGRRRDDDHGDDRRGRRGRRESWFENIFDIFED